MKIKKMVLNNKLIVFTVFAYLAVLIYNDKIFIKGIINTGIYLKEMLEIMPAIFIIAALINTWVPSEIIMENFGEKSGLKGKLFSLFIGSISAGPIYAAFPIAQSLLFKGASISNVIIIISAWAVVKIPMLLVEIKFLGVSFAAARYLFTIPSILLIGIIAEKFISKEEILLKADMNNEKEDIIERLEKSLPGFNCGSCGYISCNSYAKAIVNEKENINKCVPGGEEVKKKLNLILIIMVNYLQ